MPKVNLDALIPREDFELQDNVNSGKKKETISIEDLMSTLSAWVNDDYGDGDISKKFYDGVISEEQSLIATKTRNIVNKKIGSYNSFKTAFTRPDDVKPEVVKYAKNLEKQKVVGFDRIASIGIN